MLVIWIVSSIEWFTAGFPFLLRSLEDTCNTADVASAIKRGTAQFKSCLLVFVVAQFRQTSDLFTPREPA